MIIKIMTFNTQHCKNFNTNKIDYNSIIDLIKKYNVDIIGLNEIFAINNKKSQASIIANKLKYNHYFGKATNIILPYGNALISKYPILKSEVFKIDLPKIKTGKNHYEKRSIIESQIMLNNKLFNFYITHIGLNKDEQEIGIKMLSKIANKKNTIIMGDFNIESNDNCIDYLNGYVNTENFIKNGINTYPSDKPIKKLDYIFTSKDIKIVSVKVIDVVISDHKPILLEIEVN